MSRIVTIVGARPQFIKASVVSKAFAEIGGIHEVVVHTGQHFDSNMSAIFFEQLNIRPADYSLNINSGSHGNMTGRMIIGLEEVLLREKPHYVVLYGDTNSTLSGALSAAKLNIPIAHIEAGLRSFNMQMPEELNRVLTDRVSTTLFCPTTTAVSNLKKEGYPFVSARGQVQRIEKVGDVMQDSTELFSSRAVAPRGFEHHDSFVLATIHRAENTDQEEHLRGILAALTEVAKTTTVVLPIHPRTRNMVSHFGLDTQNLTLIEPVGYLEMLWLLQRCGLVVTDSGGLQKEAFFMGKACVTVREQTEWTELVEAGVNELTGTDTDAIVSAVKKNFGRSVQDRCQLYGGGQAALRIAKYMRQELGC